MSRDSLPGAPRLASWEHRLRGRVLKPGNYPGKIGKIAEKFRKISKRFF